MWSSIRIDNNQEVRSETGVDSDSFYRDLKVAPDNLSLQYFNSP